MSSTTIEILTLLISHFDEQTQINSDNGACICGHPLKKMNALLLYDGNVMCDICGIGSECRVFWHCSMEYNLFHPDGYDICNFCLIQSTQLTEQENKENTIHSHDHHLLFSSLNASPGCSNKLNCAVLNDFIKTIKQYNQDHVNKAKNLDKLQLTNNLNNYLHILHQHDDDKQFQYIFDQLEGCDTEKCEMFQRNNRNRTSHAVNDEKHHEYNVACSIMDKMHCYFAHSYDVGSRIYSPRHTERKELNNDAKENVTNTEHDESTFVGLRFQTLFEIDNDSILQSNTFRFGNAFKYGYKGEIGCNYSSVVSPKYSTFRDELLQNPFCRLNIAQFKNEYAKAAVHLNSAFCKNHPQFQPYVKEYDITTLKKVRWTLKLEYLLAIMIYCNYDKIQYYFSKTYRENDGNDHCNFFYWGKNVKIVVQHFGTEIKQTLVSKFYHGVNHKVYLPAYSHFGLVGGLIIFGPLSTSSSDAVAFRFATSNGLVVELSASGYITDKCFSAAWLSNYPGEKEYLFVQSIAAVRVSNIIEPDTRLQYQNILKATWLAHNIRTGEFDDIKDVNMDKSMHGLMARIFEHQLSKVFPSEYQSFQTTNFAKQIMDASFKSDQEIEIDYWKIRKYASFIAKFLVYDDFEWVRLNLINLLFPMLRTMTVKRIIICDKIFDDILSFLQNPEVNWKTIKISDINENSKVSFKDVIHKYSLPFRKIGVCIYEDIPEMELCMKICKPLGFVVEIIKRMNEIYFYDSDGMIVELMKGMLYQKLCGSINNMNALEAKIQELFSLLCAQTEVIQIIWNIFSSNKDSCLYKLISHPKIDGWIKIDVLTQLFPNMNHFQIIGGNLCALIMDDILNYLRNNPTSKINLFLMADPVENQMSRQEAVKNYAGVFDNTIKWNIKASESSGEKNLFIQRRG